MLPVPFWLNQSIHPGGAARVRFLSNESLLLAHRLFEGRDGPLTVLNAVPHRRLRIGMINGEAKGGAGWGLDQPPPPTPRWLGDKEVAHRVGMIDGEVHRGGLVG